MAHVPRQLVERVQFFETKLVSFAAHAAEIGLTEADVAALRARADAAREAHRAQRRAMDVARSATLTFNVAVDALSSFGQATIDKVRAFARATGDEGVFPLASLTPIAKGSPLDAPGKPSRLDARLDGDGSLVLTWACDNPRRSRGTVYELHRRLGDDGPFVHLGTVGRRRFVDRTIPAGATALAYEVRAMRSTRTGNPARFDVNFGTNGAGRAALDLRRAA